MNALRGSKSLLICVLVALPGCGRLLRAKGNDKVGSEDTKLLALGDSLSTGIFTSPRFSLDYGALIAQAVKGERANPTGVEGRGQVQPVRIRQPEQEISNLGKGGPAVAEALLKVIEWPELSWASLMASDLQTDGKVVIAARNGAESVKATEEVEAWINNIKDNAKPRLPSETYLFFSGDDLCRKEDQQDQFTQPADFANHIRDGVLRLATAGDPNPEGTTVYLVSHLDILQLVTIPDVLGKKRIRINDNGERELSCLEFAKEYQHRAGTKRPEDQLLSFTYNPMSVCYNVLAHATGLDPAQAKVPLTTLKSTQDAYREGLRKLAEELQSEPRLSDAKIKVKLITNTHDLVMTSDDVANDCFHLSYSGQERLAKAIREGR